MKSQINWAELRKREIDPKTPAEYAEAVRRLIDWFMKHWDELQDGDGESITPDEEPQTKTDVFHLIANCADCACENIKNFSKFMPGGSI